jgi:hypothetical protein
MEAGEHSWMAHAWVLERVWPERYALKTIQRTEESVSGTVATPIRIIGMSEQEIDKLQGDQYKRLENGNVERMVAGVKVIYAKIG